MKRKDKPRPRVHPKRRKLRKNPAFVLPDGITKAATLDCGVYKLPKGFLDENLVDSLMMTATGAILWPIIKPLFGFKGKKVEPYIEPIVQGAEWRDEGSYEEER